MKIVSRSELLQLPAGTVIEVEHDYGDYRLTMLRETKEEDGSYKIDVKSVVMHGADFYEDTEYLRASETFKVLERDDLEKLAAFIDRALNVYGGLE